MRLIRFLDVPVSAGHMAVDAAILESMGGAGLGGDDAVLRFYRWPRPTLSLGYFQKLGDRGLLDASASIDVVRRASGGGAIVHHHEWTYSLSLPDGLFRDRLRGAGEATDWMYRGVHRIWCDAMRAIGVGGVVMHEDDPRQHRGCDAGGGSEQCEAFLCFHRRSQYDLILSGYKILGSAQRRGRGGRLQHGSLLWRASEFAPTLPGVIELTPVSSAAHATSAPMDLIERFSRGVADWLGVTVIDRLSLDPFLADKAKTIDQSKFASDKWLQRR